MRSAPMHGATGPAVLLLLAGCLGSTSAFARELTQELTPEDPCATFSWNVSHERMLFATPGTSVSAAGSIPTSSTLIPEQLYLLQLLIQISAAPAAQLRLTITAAESPSAN